MNDHPVLSLFAQAHGQTKIKRTARRTVAVEETARKGHILTRGYLHCGRLEDNRSARIREEEIPRAIVFVEPADLIREIKHHQISSMVCKDRSAITGADGSRPLFDDCTDFILVVHFHTPHSVGDVKS